MCKGRASISQKIYTDKLNRPFGEKKGLGAIVSKGRSYWQCCETMKGHIILVTT